MPIREMSLYVYNGLLLHKHLYNYALGQKGKFYFKAILLKQTQIPGTQTSGAVAGEQ